MTSSAPTNDAIPAGDSYLSNCQASSRVAQDRKLWTAFWGAAFLVVVPVFFQAPLVHWLPGLSLVLTLGWMLLSFWLWQRQHNSLWADLIMGFSWSWLAGSIYWGWFRFEPLIHLPIEAIAVPLAILCLRRSWLPVGSLFYLGCLLGTAITDAYFYLTDLVPLWRQLMMVDLAIAPSLLQQCLVQIQTPWGIGWAGLLSLGLIALGWRALAKSQPHWWAFGGAIFSTILVDILFGVVAAFTAQ